MLGFVIAIAAGFLTTRLVDPVARPVAAALRGSVDIEEAELTLLSFVIVMIVAGVLAAATGNDNGVSLIIGGGLGYFGQRILQALKVVIDGKPKG